MNTNTGTTRTGRDVLIERAARALYVMPAAAVTIQQVEFRVSEISHFVR